MDLFSADDLHFPQVYKLISDTLLEQDNSSWRPLGEIDYHCQDGEYLV
jgi:hypothetical protein